MRVTQRLALLAVALLLPFLACVDPAKAPGGLTYSLNPATYELAVAIKDNPPTLAAGSADSYAISPSLPTGLSFSKTTGVISGTPTVLADQATYTVTAKNGAGSTTVALLLAVVDPAPANLTYALNPATYTAGHAIAPNTPTSSGGAVTSYTVLPALPPGLTLSPTTGIISGTPTDVAPAADYDITAANSGGSTHALLNLAVDAPSLAFTELPANVAVLVGQTARFSATVAGTGAFTYQWSRNGAAIPGATAATYITPATVIGDTNATFMVSVSDAFGSTIFSPAATLTVSTLPPGLTSPTGSLTQARRAHSATLLGDGKVLVVGGFDNTSLASAELYDPATYRFTATGSLGTARNDHTATLLPNGKVLIAGGQSFGAATATAELYDPATGTFAPTSGTLGTARTFHTATLLADGKVLFVGGRNGTTSFASAELFDPATGLFTPTSGAPVTSRGSHTATLLLNNRVLIAGGATTSGSATTVQTGVELYDPTTGLFTATTGSLATGRAEHEAVLLSNGSVLLVGGAAATAAEVFSPAGGGTFTAAPGALAQARVRGHAATLLGNGNVLISGGEGAGSPTPYLASTEVFGTALGTFSATANLGSPRVGHTATRLTDGKVLLTGGTSGLVTTLDTAELYQ